MIDIILVTYNRPRLLKIAVRSILSQTYKDWKLYIMDDGSEFKNEIDNDSRIKYYYFKTSMEERMRCPAITRLTNAALEISNSPFIMYLDDDCAFFPDWLEKAYPVLKKYPAIFGKLVYVPINKLLDFSHRGAVRYYDNCVQIAGGKLDRNQVAHRRECLEKTGLWPYVSISATDAIFLNTLSGYYPIMPVNTFAVQYGIHEKNWLGRWNKQDPKEFEGLQEKWV